MTMRPDLVVQVATARAQLASMMERLEGHREEFNTTHKNLLENITAQGRAIEEAEEALGKAALLYYDKSEDKKGHPGVTIHERVRLAYDTATALSWGQGMEEHGDIERGTFVTPPALKKGPFETHMRNTNALPGWVTRSYLYHPALDSDMDKAAASVERGEVE